MGYKNIWVRKGTLYTVHAVANKLGASINASVIS